MNVIIDIFRHNGEFFDSYVFSSKYYIKPKEAARNIFNIWRDSHDIIIYIDGELSEYEDLVK